MSVPAPAPPALGTATLGLRFAYDFVSSPFDEPAPPAWPHPAMLEFALRQWRLAAEFALFLGDPANRRGYKQALERNPRGLDPPPDMGLRIRTTSLASPWQVVLDLGPAVVASAGAVRLLFYLVEEAFTLPLRIKVKRRELQQELQALSDDATALRHDAADPRRGDPEIQPLLDQAVADIRASQPYYGATTLGGTRGFVAVTAQVEELD